MAEHPDWRRGIRYGLMVLLLALLSEGGLVVAVMILLGSPLSGLALAALATMPVLLFLFGVVFGAFRGGEKG